MFGFTAARMKNGDEKSEWSLVIKPRAKWYDLELGEILRYKDLLFLFVRRDFVANYKQTILGPTWLIIQPIVSALVFMVVFGGIAKIPTDGVPGLLFYLGGLTAWYYFADCLNKTANSFTNNAGIFGKVYFPRLILPLADCLSALIKFGVQLLLFLVILAGFFIFEDPAKMAEVQPQWQYIWLIIPLLLMMAGMGLALGIMISSLTFKYRDLQFMVRFGVQLLMYAAPVIYPMSQVPSIFKPVVAINPMASIIETFKFIFLGKGEFSWMALIYPATVAVVGLFIALVMFKRVEKTVVDSV